MKIPKQARRDAKHLFGVTLINGTMDEGRVRQSMELLLAQKPRGYLAVASHFQRLVKLEIERRTALVQSATVLGSELKAGVLAQLSQRYGSGLNVTFGTDATLLGGLRVQVGSDVYDGSVKARLAALKNSF
ncbi:MAG: F0F1 ATP synthase subunit delta [Verrucomicrobia bacterium]|nr:F0F1 ATP synthase subunit delta [Verrucomicrobiota bacterium]